MLILPYSQHGRSQARGQPISHPSHHIIDDEDNGSHHKASRARTSQHTAQSSLSPGHNLNEDLEDAAQSDSSDPGDDAPHNDDLDPMDNEESHNVSRGSSRGSSCTPSSSDTSLKRRASSCESLKETKVQRTSSGRPKAADYDDSDKALILSAISHYRTELGTDTAFPDMAKEAEMLGQVWQEACVRLDITGPITPRIAKLVKFS
jgi:hypothetical protein